MWILKLYLQNTQYSVPGDHVFSWVQVVAAEAVAQDQVLVKLTRLGVAQQHGDQPKNNQ